ncbi:MAG TPA: PAS domain S-box protein [Methylomirabilota bacterium]|nr:PAS domain S-box protein [Methylomirabilota bacterium]
MSTQPSIPSSSSVPADMDAALAEIAALRAEVARLRAANSQVPEGATRDERLRVAQVYGGVGVWSWDVATGCVSVEPEFEILYGAPPGSCHHYTDWAKFVEGEELKRGEAERDQALRERRPFEVEFRIRRGGDGQVRWLLSRGRGEYDEAGNLTRVLGVNIDITEQKRVQQELARTSERLELAQRAACIGVFDWYIPTGQLVWSGEEERIFGLERGAFEGHIDGWARRVVPEDRSRVQGELAAAMAAGKRDLDFRFRIIRPDGEIRVIEGAGRFVYENGQASRMVGVNIDVTDREAAHQALRASAVRLRRIIDANVVGLLLADFQGNVSEVNDAFLSIVGYSREDFKEGKINWLNLTPDEHRARDEQAMEEMRRSGRHAPFEKEYIRKDGTRVPVLIGTAYLPDERLGIGFIIDLTTQKKTEQALRESEAQLRTLAEAVPALVWITEPNGHLIYLNARWVEYTGQAEHEYRGYGWAETIHPEDRPAVLANWERCTQTGATYEGEARYRRSDGTYRWHFYRGVPLRDSQGLIRAWYGACVDIHERKQGEVARQESERQFREMADIAPAILWITDENGYCTFLSRGWHEFTGQTDAEASGLGWTNAIHPDDRQDARNAFLQASQRRESYQFEYRLKRKEGDYRWVLDAGRPRISPDDRFLGIVGSVIDIHERKLARDRLRKTNEELDQKVQERTAKLQETVGELEAFSYSISHDLRAPLRAMSGYAQALAEDCAPKLDPEHRDYLQRIQRAATRLDGLINDVLNYSRLGRGDLNLHPINLEALIADVLEQYPTLHPAKARVVVHKPIPRVIGNEALLSQAVSNLLINAAKFVKPGVFPEIEIRALAVASGRVRIEVQDNGIGIAAHNLARVFKLFQRVNPETLYEGTGVGLSIVKKAIERLGGEVGVNSEPGKGSIFWFELPAVQQL